jgi:predicted amidohydrolase
MEIETMDLGVFKMGIFPHLGQVGAAICWDAWYKPSSKEQLFIWMQILT